MGGKFKRKTMWKIYVEFSDKEQVTQRRLRVQSRTEPSCCVVFPPPGAAIPLLEEYGVFTPLRLSLSFPSTEAACGERNAQGPHSWVQPSTVASFTFHAPSDPGYC